MSRVGWAEFIINFGNLVEICVKILILNYIHYFKSANILLYSDVKMFFMRTMLRTVSYIIFVPVITYMSFFIIGILPVHILINPL
jgi:hypothetical protein